VNAATAGIAMAVGQHAHAEQAAPPAPWGYQLTLRATGAVLVRCAKDTPHPMVDCYDRLPIPFGVHYAECSCGLVVRNGRVSQKNPMAVSGMGHVEFTAPEVQSDA
jgi:hypothetical protein